MLGPTLAIIFLVIMASGNVKQVIMIPKDDKCEKEIFAFEIVFNCVSLYKYDL